MSHHGTQQWLKYVLTVVLLITDIVGGKVGGERNIVGKIIKVVEQRRVDIMALVVIAVNVVVEDGITHQQALQRIHLPIP